MDESSLFLKFSQGDSTANQYFSDSITNFEYGEHLVSLLENNIQNPKLFILIAIILGYFVEKYKVDSENNSMMIPIFSRLITLVFQIPVIIRDQLINILKDECSTNVGMNIFEMVIPYFNSESSIINICSSLLIMSSFISSLKENECFGKEQYAEFWGLASNILFNHADELTCVQISTIITYIESLTERYFIADINLLNQLSIIILNLLDRNDENEDVVNMKRTCIKLLNKWISINHQEFDIQILPLIEEKLISTMTRYANNRSEQGDSILCMLFEHAIIYLKNKEIYGEIYNQYFITEVLIPSMILSDSQIKEFFQNPSQYICFVLGSTLSETDYLRVQSFKLLKLLVIRIGFDPLVYEIGDESKYIIEAKVFAKLPIYKLHVMPSSVADVLISILDQVIENAIEIDPELIRSQVESDLEENRELIIDLLLLPTLMLALTCSKGCRPELMELAINTFISSPDSSVVLKSTSILLIKSLIEQTKEFQYEDIPGFISSLLFCDNVIGKRMLLEKMMEYSNNAARVGLEIYNELIGNWSELIEAIAQGQVGEDDIGNEGKYMNGLILLASALPVPILKDKLGDCLEITASILQAVVENGIEIIGLLTEMLIRIPSIDETANEIVMMMGDVIEAHIEGIMDLHLQEIASIIIILAQKSNLCQNETALSTAVQLIAAIVESDSDNSQMLLALSALVCGEPALADDAITIIRSIEDFSIPSAYVLTSCLMVGATLDNMPEEIIHSFMELLAKTKIDELCHRELRMLTHCLILLARNGFEDSFGVLLDSMSLLVLQMQRKNKQAQKENEMKAATEDDKFADDLEMCDDCEDGNESFYIDSRITIAVEEANVLQLFMNTINELNLEIDERLRSSIQAMLIE